MTDALPTVRQINSATAPLRQAYELSVQIEAMNSFAPDALVDKHRRQFLFQMEQVASRLGYELKRPEPSDNHQIIAFPLGR